MIFLRKKSVREKLLHSFGKLKEDPFDFELIETYFRKKDKFDAFQVLSDKTWHDLDFNELFMFLDRTTSNVGQQYLYHKLHTISNDSNQTECHELIIREFINNPEFRITVQSQLYKLNSIQTYLIPSLFQDEHLKKPKWFFIIPLLSLLSLISSILVGFYHVWFFVLAGIFIINLGIYYWNKNNLFVYLGSIPQLLRLNGVVRKLLVFGIFRDITEHVSESVKSINTIRNRMSFFKLEVKFESRFEVFFGTIIEFIKILFLLEPILLFDAIKQLEIRKNDIERLYKFVGQVDVLNSIASLRFGLQDYCLPDIGNSGKVLKFKSLVHPLINDCIPNDLEIGNKSILLTGSNMSGKTSFIRAIGINMITGLTLNTCFAREFAFSRLNIFSVIRISDDLLNDKSYYFEEVISIKGIIDKCNNGTKNLFLLDEIFKGTNTVERISAGKAVLSHLAKADNIVFVSTHDIELADLLQHDYELFHFSEIVNQNTVDFDYKLKPGKLKTRNAIKILRINDYPESIIQEALAISELMDGNQSVG